MKHVREWVLLLESGLHHQAVVGWKGNGVSTNDDASAARFLTLLQSSKIAALGLRDLF